MKVAVIGAGAAGLVTARELLRENHEVCLLEQSSQVGGTWVHEAKTENDPLGANPDRRIHSSMYDSLRTNLPRDLMAFLNYPFDSSGGGKDYWQRYPHHTKVLAYLEAFSRDFSLTDLIRFNEQVVDVRRDDHGWRVQSSSVQYYDAVAVCNGHYSVPRGPSLAGADFFKGVVLHSHNYRNPLPFKDQIVAVLGAAASGTDIARELATTASKVIWCGGAENASAKFALPRHPFPRGFNNDGELMIDGYPPVAIDALVFCTGYHYEFPFLDSDIVTATDNCVHPLYLDILPPEYPTLAFIGLPYLVIPFPLFEMQARWFARLLSSSHTLPSTDDMLQSIETRIEAVEHGTVKRRHFHKLGEGQIPYINSLAAQCGAEPLPDWYEHLAREAQQARLSNPELFRETALRHAGDTVILHSE